MNANKDEAFRCLELARRRMAAARFDEARKFAVKAKKLDPSLNLGDVAALFHGSSNTNEHRCRRNSSSGRKPSTSNDRTEDSPSGASFTKAQTEEVRKLLACKDYYELLGVTKDCTEDDIKKAYKLRALKCHPDKNRAPGATEAFKKIGTALDVLTDPEKRRRYDQFGTVDDDSPRIANYSSRDKVFFRYDGHQAFDGDVFSMFFNGGFPFAQVYRGHRHRPSQTRESEREPNYFAYLQLLPLLILFGLSFFSSLFVREPYYNLARSSKYSVERHTINHNVAYYVKPSFEKDFDGRVTEMERQVEEEFVGNLRYRCYREKEYRENLMFRARYYGDEAGLDRARNLQMPNCDTLINVFGG